MSPYTYKIEFIGAPTGSKERTHYTFEFDSHTEPKKYDSVRCYQGFTSIYNSYHRISNIRIISVTDNRSLEDLRKRRAKKPFLTIQA